MAKIPIILEPGRADGKLVASDSIFDKNKNKFQNKINQEVEERLNDVKDTLNSDSTTTPLSAKQGKVLKELLDSKVIETGSIPIDSEPILGNTTHIVNSDGLAKEFNKCNTTIINTDRIANEAIVPSKLSTDIQSLISNLSKTATFAGIATPTTNPGTPDGSVFYIANGKGTYTNFSGIEVTEDEVVVLYWDTAWHKEATWIASNDKLTELEKKVGVTISYTDAIPANGEYINRAFHLEEGEDAGLSVNADAISKEGTAISFYIYKSDGSSISMTVRNNKYYDSVRALFGNYAGEITGYSYYITTFNVGDVITSFTYYGLDKEIENVKKDTVDAQREISNTANNLAYTQALAGGETHIKVEVKKGVNLEPDTKFSLPIKSGAKITFSADLYDVVSNSIAVYLWYSDGSISSYYSVGFKINIDKDVDYIGLYIPGSSIVKDGSIMIAAIYENATLNTAIEYADSKDKVYKLVVIGQDTTKYHNWKVGDLYFSTTDNKIYECTSTNPIIDTEPTEILQRGLFYLCDNVLYTFDGLSLTKYHDKDVIDGVLVDYPQFLVGENINNDSTGGDKSTYIYKDLIKFDVAADEEIEISCSKIIDSKVSAPIILYGYDATGNETEIKSLAAGINIVTPSLSYKSIKVRLYPTTSGMSAMYCTFENIKIRKYKRTDIPAYYIKDNYIKNKIDVIRKKMVDASGNFDAFVFITDLHWLRNAKNSPAIINYLQNKIQIPRVIMGGDYADGINMDYLKAFNGFNGKIYRAIGNHEYMNYWDEDGVFSQKDITDANIWAVYQSGMTDIVIGDANTNYYYVDNVVQKMRYIILSVFTDGSEGKFEQTQATWLNDSLANMPNGYTAIVIAHYYAHINYPDFTPVLTTIGKQIADICDNHIGNVACLLQGHTHEDLMMKTDGGIPIFATTCDKSTADNDETSEEDNYIYGKRTNGTITEQAFDIVIINKKDKKVSLVRIGAPADKDGVNFYEVREQTYL